MRKDLIIDLHIHTNRSSCCSSLAPEEMIEAAGKLGLDERASGLQACRQHPGGAIVPIADEEALTDTSRMEVCLY
jgi:hypothetical protein